MPLHEVRFGIVTSFPDRFSEKYYIEGAEIFSKENDLIGESRLYDNRLEF